VEDGDVLAFEILGDVLAGDATLLVVTAADAERVPQALLGDRRFVETKKNLKTPASA